MRFKLKFASWSQSNPQSNECLLKRLGKSELPFSITNQIEERRDYYNNVVLFDKREITIDVQNLEELEKLENAVDSALILDFGDKSILVYDDWIE